MKTAKTVHEAFVRNYLTASGIEHEEADNSVGITSDTWYVDTATLADMLTEYMRLIVGIQIPKE